jgi:5-methyltetrahydrofolate--homocysteine methyltransferase
MSDLGELRAAVSGAREAADLPIVATMTFDTHGHTMMGVSPARASEELSKLDLVAYGANCGNGPGEIEKATRGIRGAAPEALLIAKSNAGIPHLVNGTPVYDATPEIMAEHARHALELGSRLIGGCCGNTPDHIRAMATALNSADIRGPS